MAFPATESSGAYDPPTEQMMGPPVYPLGRDQPRMFNGTPYPQFKRNFKGGYDEYYNQQWSLPPAMINTGAMLVLLADPGLWADVIARWESITINRLNEVTWTNSKEKLVFVENLFGENEKHI